MELLVVDFDVASHSNILLGLTEQVNRANHGDVVISVVNRCLAYVVEGDVENGNVRCLDILSFRLYVLLSEAVKEELKGQLLLKFLETVVPAFGGNVLYRQILRNGQGLLVVQMANIKHFEEVGIGSNLLEDGNFKDIANQKSLGLLKSLNCESEDSHMGSYLLRCAIKNDPSEVCMTIPTGDAEPNKNKGGRFVG